MDKKIWLFAVIAVILLGACQPAATQIPSVTPEEAPASTATLTEESAFEEPTATDFADVTAEASATVEVSLGCTVVTQRGQPTPESLFRTIEDIDHVLGPNDARVTFMEYSDFQ